jgi:cytosine/uracil/thiamine/allantoin permease
VLAVAVGALCTAGALVLHIAAYQKFLLLIGSVFVPLFGTFAADYFVLNRGHWDVSARARARWQMLLPWVAGFVTYQLVNPSGSGVGSWGQWWTARQHALGITVPDWASASLLSLLVSAGLALVVGYRRSVADAQEPAT